MIKHTKLALAFTCALIGSPALAETYLCEFTRGGSKGWIPTKILVNIDAEAGTAGVMDGLTLSKQEGLFPAKISANTKKRYTISWSVKRLKSNTGQNVNADFRLSLQKTSLIANVSMLPQGYDNKFSTRGPCKPQ